MSAAAPWSVKGIDPKAREVAKDLARRSGMTLGEWLNTMIMDDEEEAASPTLAPRRSSVSDIFEPRRRQRRYEDAYGDHGGSDETLQRVAASVDAIAARLEAAERRSTVAIQGVDQAVSGLVRRLDGQDALAKTHARRIDDIAEELREGHRRLRTFESEVGPDTKKTFGKVETSVAALASRLYDIEERQRDGVNELRARMEAVEKTAGPGVGTDLLAQVGARLDSAQARTTEALKGLERSFAGLDQRLRTAEGRVEPEGAREAARFEKLAETLSRQVEAGRSEMMRRLDTAEHEGRLARIEGAVQAIDSTVKSSEQRSAQGIEAMGREVLRIAQNLNGRAERTEALVAGQADSIAAAVTQKVEGLGEAMARKVDGVAVALNEKLDRDLARHAQLVEHRMTRSDDQHALALEKLGGEITRISDRLADRIAQSERKSAQALEDIGRRVAENSDKIEQRHDRASSELAERMLLSEERTVRLLAEARETLSSRPDREPSRASSRVTAPEDLRQPDWRAAAFGDGFETDADDGWSVDALAVGPEPAPFPGSTSGVVRERAAPPATLHHEPEPEPIAAAFASIAQPAVSSFATPAVEPEPTFVSEPDAESIYASDWSDTTTTDAEPEADLASDAEPAVEPEVPVFAGFGGADVEDALEATRPQAFGAPASFAADPAFDDADFAAETDFVNAGSMRSALAAGAASGRATSTRSAIDAARAAMVAPAEEPVAARSGFSLGLKRGGKSRLQERLDKQANKEGVVRKALLASVTGMALVGATYSTWRLIGPEAFSMPGLGSVGQALGLGAAPGATAPAPAETTPLAAVALTPTDAVSVDPNRAQALFDRATEQLDQGQSGGVETLTSAANLGLPVAQLKLADLYERGENVARNVTEARLWARRAAEGGDARGMHAYGMYLFDGVGGARNRPEALTWLVKAANKGLVDSQYNVARLYENGDEGIAPNPTEALKWYMIAARTGDADAQGAVARLTPEASPSGRRTAQAAANAFKTEPLG